MICNTGESPSPCAWGRAAKAAVVAVGLLLAAGSATASTLLGTAGDYTVLAQSKLTLNQGDVSGQIGLGAGGIGVFQKSTVNGDILVDSTATYSISAKDFVHNGAFVDDGSANSAIATAYGDAVTASAYLAGLPIDASLGDITTGMTFTGSGGTKVYDVNLINTKETSFTFVGDGTDLFIFNVHNGFDMDLTVFTLNGVTTDQIIFNLLGSGPDSEINKAGSHFKGTILAVDRKFTFKDGGAVFDGRIIADEVLVISGGEMFGPAASNGTVIPAPAALPAGLVCLAVLSWKRRRRLA